MVRALSIALTALLLTACGGGGGGSSSTTSPPPTPPPTSPPPPPAVTATLTSSASSVSYGDLVKLTILGTHATDCELTSNAPDATNPLSRFVGGTVQARVYSTTTFTYSCTGRTEGTTARSDVTVAVSTPALTYSVSHGAVNDIAWDASRGILYLALGAASRIAPNSVAAFDPVTSTVLATSFAGSEPNTIALNEDGSKLYVGFRTSNTVSRFSTPALTRDFIVPIPLPSSAHSAGSPDFAFEIAAAPGPSEKFAVSLYQSQVGESTGRFITFDGANSMPATTIEYTGQPGPYEQGTMLAWVDANSLLTLKGAGSSAEIARYETHTGRVENRGRVPLWNRSIGSIAHDRGRVYTNCGHVVDAATLQQLPSYPHDCDLATSYNNDQVAPDSANNRMFFVSRREDSEDSSFGYVISVHRQDTLELLHKARIPERGSQLSGKISNFQRIGPDGLAVTTSGGDLIIVSGPFVAPNGSSTMAGTLPPGTPNAATYMAQFDVLLPGVVDMAWDASRDRLYAAMATDAPEHAGELAIFQFPDRANPTFVSLPFAVSELDVTDDGQFLYVIRDGAMERLRLPDFVSERQITFNGTPQGVRAAPGRPLTVVVGASVYDDATRRGLASDGRMRWGATADRLYAYNSNGSGFNVTSFDTRGSAVTPLRFYDRIFSSVHPFPFYSGYTQSGGLLYADTGVVFDPETAVVNGIFAIGPTSGAGMLSAPFDNPIGTAAWGPVAIDETNHRAYIAGCVGVTNEDLCTSFLQVYDTRTYVPLVNSVLNIGGRARKLLRLGSHGLVAITYDRRVIYTPEPASLAP